MGSLALRPGDSLTIPRMALSVGFIRFGFLHGCNPRYGGSDYSPGGTTSPLNMPAFAGHAGPQIFCAPVTRPTFQDHTHGGARPESIVPRSACLAGIHVRRWARPAAPARAAGGRVRGGHEGDHSCNGFSTEAVCGARKPGRASGSPGFRLPLAIEGPLFPEEEILSRQRCSRPETRRHDPQAIDPDRGQYPTWMKRPTDLSHKSPDSPLLVGIVVRCEFESEEFTGNAWRRE